MTNDEGQTAYRRGVVEYLEIPLRRPWYVLVPLVLGSLAALGLSFKLPKRYVTSTLILVESQKVPDSVVRRDPEATRPRLLTIKQEILSRTRLERVIHETDPYPELARAPLTSIVETMRGAIEINVRGNDAFTIEYVHRNPRKAMDVANRLATLFIEESSQAREEQVEGASEFIESQLQDSRHRLEEKEEAIRRFKEANLGHLPEQTQANLATLQRLQMEQQSVNDNLRAARERELMFEKGVADDREPAGRSRGEGRPDPSTELEQLRSQLVALLGRYTDEHPDVKNLKARIAELERRVADGGSGSESPGSIRHAQLEQARQEVKLLETKRVDLEQRIASFQRRVEEVPRTEQELATLTRDYQKLNENYLSLLNKKLDAQMAERLEKRWKGERFRVLDPAYLPEQASFPNPRLFLAVGALAGFLLGLVAAFVSDYFDHSIKSPGELELLLPYPVVAAFPHLDLAKGAVVLDPRAGRASRESPRGTKQRWRA